MTETLTSHRSRPRIERESLSGAVVVNGLTKRYGDRVAVDSMTFSIPPGTIAGLIGPNGAGKTTLMAMLLGLVRPSAGSAQVLGCPISRPRQYLSRVGALIETPAFQPGVSGAENLKSLAILGGHSQKPIPDLLELVGLAGRENNRYGSYSLGMKQRLGIAASLLGEPELVILDEPTNGLDPAGMQDIRRIIGHIAAEGRTVVVSSHLLSELEHVCDWLVVLDHGGLTYLGTPSELPGAEDLLVLAPEHPNRLEDLVTLVKSCTDLEARLRDSDVVVELPPQSSPSTLALEINRRAHQTGMVLSELHYERADLETRYLSQFQGES